ncbi:hypothetical protein GZL_09273 [Streptomyces sp. 769]|nr:hypothetical protein GZL_09273 [Streptomyces sp. 769]
MAVQQRLAGPGLVVPEHRADQPPFTGARFLPPLPQRICATQPRPITPSNWSGSRSGYGRTHLSAGTTRSTSAVIGELPARHTQRPTRFRPARNETGD